MGMPVLLVSNGAMGDWWRECVLTRSGVELAQRFDYDSAYEALLTAAWRLFVVEHRMGDPALGMFLWRIRVSPWKVPPRGVLLTSSDDPLLRQEPIVRVVRHPPQPEELDRALSPLLDLPVRDCCRLPLNLAVTGRGAQGKTVTGTTADLSSGGMLIQTAQAMAMGERLAWAFPEAAPLKGLSLRGATLRQRWPEVSSSRRLFAVKFDATASRERNTLERFLREALKSRGTRGPAPS